MKNLTLVILFSLLFCGCLKKEVQTGVGEQEAEEIIVLLKDNGIEAFKQLTPGEIPTWAIFIRGGDQDLLLAWRILQEHGLPRQKPKGLEEVFSKSGLIPTASEEKARLILGLSGEMRRTLESVAGVVEARVHVVLPENSPLIEKAQWSLTTASVLIKYRGDQLPLREEEIKNLVAKGVEGLQPDNVAVVFKKVESKPVPSRDMQWYLRSQQVTVSSLALLALTTVGAMALLIRGRLQKAKIQRLQKQLKAAASVPQLTAQGEAKR